MCIVYTPEQSILKIAETSYSDWMTLVHIAARVCALQLQIFNRLMLRNDNNAVLIKMVLSWVNIIPNQFSAHTTRHAGCASTIRYWDQAHTTRLCCYHKLLGSSTHVQAVLLPQATGIKYTRPDCAATISYWDQAHTTRLCCYHKLLGSNTHDQAVLLP